MIVQNVSDQIEQDHENCARTTLANFIAGKTAYTEDGDHVVHLLTEYKDYSGVELTAETAFSPENCEPFVKFCMAKLRNISELMTERSAKFHANLTDKSFSRHTPLNKQKVYLVSMPSHLMEANVLSSVYHDKYLKKVDFETVNFWQSINAPMEINITATYMKNDGTLASAAVNKTNVFGVIFDEEAIGYTTVNQWSAPAPFNAAGGYTNVYHHFTDRYWNDFTENGVVLLLD